VAFAVIRFDDHVVLASVALNRYGDKGGVDDLSAFEFDTEVGQRLIEILEQGFNQAVFLDGFAECPRGVRIGYVARQLKPEEAHEGEPVADLVLQPFIRQVVQTQQNEQLEHEHAAGGTAPGSGLAVFGINSLQQGTEDFPVNDGIQPFQCVARFAQTGVALLKLKQAGLHGRSVAGLGDL